MSKFDDLYNKIILEMKGQVPADIQIIKDVIEDDYMSEGFVFKENWEEYLPKLLDHVLEQIKYSNKYDENITIQDLDYSDLMDLVKDAFDDFDLVAEIRDPEDDEDNEDNEDNED